MNNQQWQPHNLVTHHTMIHIDYINTENNKPLYRHYRGVGFSIQTSFSILFSLAIVWRIDFKLHVL